MTGTVYAPVNPHRMTAEQRAMLADLVASGAIRSTSAR